MRGLYEQISSILDTIDFESIWPGFERCAFALYNQHEVYLKDKVIPYDRRFLGNTSIEFDGGNIAIWNVPDPSAEDSEILASGMVHEMFHAFQKCRGEKRYPNDLILLDYPDDIENYRLKHAENLLLLKAFQSDDADQKKTCLDEYMSARKFREGIVGDIIAQEYLAETVEGMAEYAGCTALKRISREKYETMIKLYEDRLRMIDGRFFDIRKSSYFSGALLCITLMEAGTHLFHDIGKTDLPLFSIAAEGCTAKKTELEIDDKLLVAEAEKYACVKSAEFEDFLSAHNERVDGNFIINRYDPMNMIKLNGMILCSHFVGLYCSDTDEQEFIHEPVVVKLRDDSYNKVQYYIK